MNEWLQTKMGLMDMWSKAAQPCLYPLQLAQVLGAGLSKSVTGVLYPVVNRIALASTPKTKL
jgi:hypothetical protein